MNALLAASVLTLTLMAGSAVAQVPVAAQQPPASPPPVTAPAEPQPLPTGAKVAFLNIQRIASESAEGRSATAKVKALNDKKVAELNEKNKNLQAAQQKLQQGGSILSDSARAQLEKDIERMQVDIQRFTQDAQADVQELQQDLQNEFQRKLLPIINAVATELALHMVFSQADSGLVWAHGGLDITDEVVARFDAQTTSSPAPAKPQD
jgi:outer membrane protein